MAKPHLINSSRRGERVLEDLGVLRAFERGEKRVLVGPNYGSRKTTGLQYRLLFARGDDRSISVGYAQIPFGGEWEVVELEPYSMRSHAYYERWIKRNGNFLRPQPLLALFTEE